MSAGFPPQSVFPTGMDTDRTLFVVYNTTESVLTANNAPWSEEIVIRPQDADALEIWADNGFATIEGELLYYDAVAKDGNDKVYKLKRCLRNLGGRHTQFNPCGTWIRSFVVAEHHTQIVDAILNVEDFVGENFTDLEETLDFRIRNLQAEPIIFDDFSCPDVSFDFNILSSDANTGTIAQYLVVVAGTQGFFELQFGDGTSTTTTSGTHNYAPNANIDPVVIVSNEDCQVVQTPIQRDTVDQPTVRPRTPPFFVPIPLNPEIPAFNFPNQGIPSVDINIPPIVFPCIDLNPLIANLPSLISVLIPSIQLPSIISFVPVLNIPSIINFVPSLSIPSTITFTNVPSFGPIGFGPSPSFDDISFIGAPSFSPISIVGLAPGGVISFVGAPSFSPISFGNITITGPSFGPIGFGPAPSFAPIEFGPMPSLIIPSITIPPVQFGDPPSFPPISIMAPSLGTISFATLPSFSPVCFCPTPSFDPINFGPSPSFGPIAFGPGPTFGLTGGTIKFGPAPVFDTIHFDAPPIFDLVYFAPPVFDLVYFAPAPSLVVTWGPVPSVTCTCQVTCPSSAPMMMRPPDTLDFDTGIVAEDPSFNNIEVQYDMVGFPSEIKITAPDIPPISVEHDIPTILNVLAPKFEDIKIIGPKEPIPSEIRIIPPDFDTIINVVSFWMPSSIRLEFDATSMPTAISLAFPEQLPDIKIDASAIPETIRVIGIPDVIRIDHAIPSVITLEAPDNLKVPLVFEGPPISGTLRVDWGFDKLMEEMDEMPCFAITPCPRK